MTSLSYLRQSDCRSARRFRGGRRWFRGGHPRRFRGGRLLCADGPGAGVGPEGLLAVLLRLLPLLRGSADAPHGLDGGP
eukprot:13926882-Heterocapsa_arctica.AAC.1